MKRHLSIGFIIFSIAISTLWATLAILHFFLVAAPGISSTDVLIKSLVQVQNQMAFDPIILVAFSICLGACIFFSLAKRAKPERAYPKYACNIAGAGLVATALWMGLALINILAFGRVYTYNLIKESSFYIALFQVIYQLAIVNYALTLVFFIVAGIFGRGILKRLWPDLQFISRLQEFLFSTTVGIGALGAAIFLIGLVHLIYPWAIILLIFGALAFGLESAPSYPFDMWKAIQTIHLPPITCILFVVLLCIIASSVHAPLIPPFMHDGMNSHLEAPKVFIREHAVSFHAYINFNNFPLSIELCYLPMIMLDRPLMTQITTYFFFLMCLAMVYEFGRVYFNSPTTGMLSAILLCLVPNFIGQFNHPTIDIALTFFIFTSGFALVGWLYGGKEKYLHLTGLILGLSLGVKYTALVFVILYVIWVLIQRILLENANVRATLAKIGLMLVIAVIAGCPWYLRNIVLFGNPFFPFYQPVFAEILPIGTLSELKPQLQINEREMLQRHAYTGSWTRIMTFLADLSYNPNPAGGAMKNQLGPLYIAILPLLFLMALKGFLKLVGKYIFKLPLEPKYVPPAWMCLFIILGYMSYWIFQVGVLQLRYLFPILPFMAALAGFTVSSILKLNMVNQRHILAIFIAACSGMLGICYFNSGVQHLPISKLPIRNDSREEFLKQYISSYEAVLELNKFLGPEDIVYGLFCENCRFYAKFTLIGGLFGYGDHQEFNKYTGTGKELYEYLKTFNCSYLMVDTKRQQIMAETYGSIKLPKDPTFNAHFNLVSKLGATEIFEIID